MASPVSETAIWICDTEAAKDVAIQRSAALSYITRESPFAPVRPAADQNARSETLLSVAPVVLSNTATPPFTNSISWVLPAAPMVSGGMKLRAKDATSYWLRPWKPPRTEGSEEPDVK